MHKEVSVACCFCAHPPPSVLGESWVKEERATIYTVVWIYGKMEVWPIDCVYRNIFCQYFHPLVLGFCLFVFFKAVVSNLWSLIVYCSKRSFSSITCWNVSEISSLTCEHVFSHCKEVCTTASNCFLYSYSPAGYEQHWVSAALCCCCGKELGHQQSAVAQGKDAMLSGPVLGPPNKAWLLSFNQQSKKYQN